MLYRANVAALLFCIVCVGLAKPVRGRGQIASRGKHVALSSVVLAAYQRKLAQLGQHKHLYNDKRWLARRAAQLRAQPLCVMCKASGFTRLATVADHIVPHRGDPNLFWYGKLQSLCLTCHNNVKQQIETIGYATRCDVTGKPLDPNHPSIASN